jgi:hypothetical protein
MQKLRESIDVQTDDATQAQKLFSRCIEAMILGLKNAIR